MKFNLHSSQQEIFFDQLLSPTSTRYTIGGYVSLRGNVNLDRLIDSILRAYSCLDILKCTFELDQGNPYLIYNMDSQTYVCVLDFSNELNSIKYAENWIKDEFNCVIDFLGKRLTYFYVAKISEVEYFLINKTHHLLFDGVGLTNLFKKIAAIYTDIEGFENTSKTYFDCIVDEQKYLQSDKFDRDTDFWLNIGKNMICMISIGRDLV